MNGLAHEFLTCAWQVTLFTTGTLLLYFATRRFDRSAAISVLIASLSVVGILTAVAAVPAVHWRWNESFIHLGFADSAERRGLRSPTPVGKTVAPLSGNSVPLVSLATEVDGPFTTVATDSLPTSPRAKPSAPVTEARLLIRRLQTHWPRIILLFACTAIAVGLARFLLAGMALRTFRRTSTPLDDDCLQQTATALSHRLGMSRTVPLHESARVASPATIGWWKPLILLPPAWRQWTPNERSAVLAHELAHVHLAHFPKWLLGQLVLAAHYYHPLVHLLARRLRFEHELVADDYAAAALGDRPQYSSALATLALRPAATASVRLGPGIFMSHSLLKRRLQMLGKPARQLNRKSWTRALIGMLLVFGLGVAVSGIRTMAQPAGEILDSHVDDQVTSELDAGTEEAQQTTSSRKVATQLITRIQTTSSDDERDLLIQQLSALLQKREAQSQEPTHVATALFQVSSTQPSLIGDREQRFDINKWKQLCATQLALLKSYLVLSDALRDPSVSQLPLIRAQRDPIAWLASELKVEFIDDSEILRIQLECQEDEIEQCRKIVDAVVSAYVNMVIFEDRKERSATRDVMTKILTNLKYDIGRNMQEIRDLAEEIGSAEFAGKVNVQQQLDLRRLERLEDELLRLDGDILASEMRLASINDKVQEQELTLQLQVASKRKQKLSQQREELVAEVGARAQQSVELDFRKRELEHRQQTANQLAQRIESMDVDMNAPQRIRKIQPAMVTLIGRTQ